MLKRKRRQKKKLHIMIKEPLNKEIRKRLKKRKKTKIIRRNKQLKCLLPNRSKRMKREQK